MANHKLRLAIRTVLSGGSLVASLGAANAQTAPATTAATTAPAEQLQEVVVTGSRISAPNQVSISPVTFVSALDVQQTGVSRVEDLLNSLPQVFAAQGSNASNAATGTASVNLRGLGDVTHARVGQRLSHRIGRCVHFRIRYQFDSDGID